MSDIPDADEMATLERAVLNLPHQQREVFLFNRLEHLGYGEIGSRLGLKRPTVIKLMGRALFNIRRQLDGERLSWWERWF